MEKINIIFDDKNYSIDSSYLETASSALQSHLSTTMSGSGAAVNFGGNVYNIDSAKLSSATNDFIAHLQSITGTGYKVVVGGVEYNIDINKVENAIAELNDRFWKLGYPGVPKVEELEEAYEFNYYSTLALAVADVNAETIGENADANKLDAVAGVYVDENAKTNILMLKSVNIEETVDIDGDVTLDLGGYNHTSSAPTAFSLSGNVVVDAIRGGGITINGETGVRLCALHFTSGTGVVNCGKYVTNSSNVATTRADIGTIVVDNGADVVINNVTSIATDDVAAAVSALFISEGGKAEVNNSYIHGICKSGYNVAGVANFGELVATDTKFIADSDYLGNEAGTDYGKFSRGVYSYGPTTLNNCYVYGTHCGVSMANAPIYINGGTYEGYGHGGLYTTSGADKINYIYDAKFIGTIDMKEGYVADDIVGNNYAGIYIGGTDTTVYMDNCYVYGAEQPIVLRDTREILYVSNSSTNTDYTKYPVRISSSSKLYIGAGNNFNKNQCSRPTAAYETGEEYRVN